MLSEQTLKRNIDRVRSRMSDAAVRAGRRIDDVRLIAITKQQTVETINAMLRLGITEIGENRVSAALEKSGIVTGAPVWHFIGNLQRNKVRRLLPVIDYFHAADSARLIEKLDADAADVARTRPLPILIEVNISGEAAKHGLPPDAVEPLLDACRRLPSVRIDGLMTMAPFTDDDRVQRAVFSGLRSLAETLRHRTGLALPELSMGMSNDFESAVEEGATLIRVGSALFEE